MLIEIVVEVVVLGLVASYDWATDGGGGENAEVHVKDQQLELKSVLDAEPEFR